MQRFLSELHHFKRRWQAGLLRRIGVAFAGWFAAVWAGLCWLDLLLAFGPFARCIVGGVFLTALMVWLGVHIVRIVRINEKQSAVHADTLIKSRRREVLTAWEIRHSSEGSSALTSYLADKGIAIALDHLRSLRHHRLNAIPKSVKRQLAVCLAVALLPALLNPRAAMILSSRYLRPYADIPPYSAYEFTITPENPEVIYGADQVITVSISGKAVSEPVRFATRKGGQVLASECFKADPDTYVQRLERVMQPMSFCFLLGNARSRWHRIDVLYQPHVTAVHIRLTPPAYTEKQPSTFGLGAEPLSGLKGSRVAMTIDSNRPLKQGDLTITPAIPGEHTQTIAGEITSHNKITFQWEITSRAQLSAMIYDILGTPAKEPLKIVQAAIADEKPAVSLGEPLAFSLATPNIKIPILASIEDDLGVRRCDLFRALKGYRSRAVPIDLVPGAANHEIQGELDLARLGVEPGQVIELFVEATDTNPDLTGTVASDIARVKIISEAAYAELVRSRTTIAAFESRFQQLAENYNTLVESIDEARSALQHNRWSDETAKEHMQQLHSQVQAAATGIKQIADDFAAFDLEKKLSDSAGKMAEHLEAALAHDGWQASDKASRLAAVTDSLERLNGQAGIIRQLKKNADEIAAVSRVMAMGVLYRTLIDRQKVLVGSLAQYAAGERRASSPKALADAQATIRKNLNEMTATLTRLAQQLPPSYEALRASALDFINKLEVLDIPTPMTAAEKASRNEQPRKAWRQATRALEKMQDVLRQCKGGQFAQTCNGNISFKVPDPLSRTMSQMLESLMKQFGSGVGWGDGVGAAGVGLAGAWEGSYLNGYSAFNMPVYGPERHNPFSSAARSTDGKMDGGAAGRGIVPKVKYNETIEESQKEKTGGESFFKEMVPPRYREAVQRFYGEDKQ